MITKKISPPKETRVVRTYGATAIPRSMILLLLLGCGGSKLAADDANKPRHAIRIIATR